MIFKNVGMMTLGICILAGAASIEMRLETIEEKLDRSEHLTSTINQIAAAIPDAVFRGGK